MKHLLILVSNFQAYNLKNPVMNKLLTFVDISGETAYIISTHVMKAIANYDLETEAIRIQTSESCSEKLKKMC
jgi:hypothetical protein